VSFRIGIDIIAKKRIDAWVQRFPHAIKRILRDDERGKELDEARLFAAKEAVVKAVGGLSIFDARAWSATKVRGGYAAIPRQKKFEQRLIQQRISWVSLSCGEAHGSVWALAVAIPRDINDYEAVITIRQVASLLNNEERLDAASLDILKNKVDPELSRVARHAAITAADTLLNTKLYQVGMLTQADDSLAFSKPKLLEKVPVSIAHDGHYVIGAVARAAGLRSIQIDQGLGLSPIDIS